MVARIQPTISQVYSSLENPVHLIGSERLRKTFAKYAPRFVAEVTRIRISCLVTQLVAADKLCRPAIQQGTDDRVRVRVVYFAKSAQRFAKDIACHDPLVWCNTSP